MERDSGGTVTAVLDDGTELRADELLVAAGRRPSTGDLGLETVGLEPGRPVDVDDQLRATGVDGGWLYAVGDCNGRAPLTHMGKYQARIAADVIQGKDVRSIADHGIVPRVTFTDPQVCAVGLTEDEAREQGLEFHTVRFPTGDVAGASVLGDEFPGTSQLVIDDKRDVLVGATFVGPGRAGVAPLGDGGDRRRGPARPALARGAVVPDGQRGVAAPARGGDGR